MQPKTLIALGAFVVVAVLAYFTMRAPEKGERIGPRPRPVPAVKAADIKELELSSNAGKDHVVLKNEGGAWKVTSPGAWNAEQSLVSAATGQLEKLAFADVVTETPAKFAELEVSDDKGTHIIAKDAAGKVLLDGWMGKSVSGFTMFRPSGKNEVWQATGVFKYTFNKTANDFRDHTIFEFNKDDVTRLAVEGNGQKLVLDRVPPPSDKDKGAEAKWKVVEDTAQVGTPDESTANNLVSTMASLKATTFADDAKAAEVGLAPPQIKIAATVKGEAKTLLVGKTQGDDTWLQVEGKPQIYLVQKWTAERLAQPPANFRDKTLVKVKEADVASVEIVYGGETLVLKHEGSTWKFGGKAAGEADEAKARAVVTAFESLQASSFAVGTKPADAGLEKPAATVTLKLAGGKPPVVVKVGTMKGEDYHVQKVGSPDVVLVKKYTVERFLKKAADVQKAKTP